MGSLRHHPRRRSGGVSLAVILALAAAVFASGLVLGRLNSTAVPQAQAAASQPMQYYPS